MANSDKNILITPNVGGTVEPKIVFTGSDNNPVSLNVQDNGTLSVEGSAGQLFSITDNMQGTLFSVNDVSGIPSIEVKDTGDINLGVYGADKVNLKQIKFADSGNIIASDSTIQSWYLTNSFSVAAQDTEPRDLFFRPNGTQMYVLGNAGDDINQYALSTPWDVTTATFEKSQLLTGGPSNETIPTGLFFRPDGLSVFVVGTGIDTVQRFNLSTAWDISTMTYASAFSVATEETSPQAIFFKPDGLIMYVMGDVGDDVNQYSLSTAWDITTASFTQLFSVSGQDSVPQGLDFSQDGSKMFIGGSTNNIISEYTLSTPWNISTAQFVDSVSIYNASTFVEAGFSGVRVREDLGLAWVSGYGTDRILQFSTNTPATKVYGSQFIVDPDAHFRNDIVGYRNQRLLGTLNVQGAAGVGSTVTAGGFTSSGTISFTTTGTANIATGTTASASTKTVNVGTGGASGSITRIALGSATAGATGKIDFQALLAEPVTVSAIAATGTIALDTFTNSNTTYYTSNATGNWTLNIRGNASTTYDSITSVGQSVEIVFAVTTGATAFYQTGFQIDGTARTIRWENAAAPTSGNANSIEVYTFRIIKTATTPTYVVLGSRRRF